MTGIFLAGGAGSAAEGFGCPVLKSCAATQSGQQMKGDQKTQVDSRQRQLTIVSKRTEARVSRTVAMARAFLGNSYLREEMRSRVWING